MKIIHSILQSEISSNHESGMSLVVAIVITTLFTSLVLVMATQQWANSNMNAVVASEQKSYYLAEAGIEFAIRRSMDLNSWNWSINNAGFADGTVSINVTQLGGDSVRIISTGQAGVSAKQNTQIINAINLAEFCVYISGDRSGWSSSPGNRTEENETNLPVMNLDSMRLVANNQGQYHPGNHTLPNPNTPWTFYSNPADQSMDANIIYVEGNLTFPWRLFGYTVWGIYVVGGDIIMNGTVSFINGVIYLPNTTTQSLVRNTWFSLLFVTGAIVGNTDIDGRPLGWLAINHNANMVNKFYTYALNSDFMQVERLTWAANY